MEKGQSLAARCSEFDYAVQNLLQAASVPIIPVTGARLVIVFFCSYLWISTIILHLLTFAQ